MKTLIRRIDGEAKHQVSRQCHLWVDTVEKGFLGGLRATLIQNEHLTRKFDSKKSTRMIRLLRAGSLSRTFSTASPLQICCSPLFRGVF